MDKEITTIDKKIKVFERDGRQWTTSLNVAEVFGKEHRNIIRDIENLECSQGFRLLNFERSNYLNSQNKEMPMYEMTRDGFSFLVMGFTGSKAAQFKEAYINAFNLMENQLKLTSDSIISVQLALEARRQETDKALSAIYEMCRSMREGFTTTDSKIVEIKDDVSQVKDDVLQVKDDVLQVKDEIRTIKDNLPLTRRSISKTNQLLHLRYLKEKLAGRCPCCGDEVIIDLNGERRNLVFDHAANRHENAKDKVWPICFKCNSDKSNGKIDNIDARRRFDGYQAGLKMWEEKKAKQQPLFIPAYIRQNDASISYATA